MDILFYHPLLTIETQSKLKLGNSCHIFLIQGEGEKVNVGTGTLNIHALGDNSDSTFDRPAEKDLSGGLTVLGGNVSDDLVTKERFSSLAIVSELNKGSRTKGRIGGNLDALLLDPFNKAGLLEIGVKFNYKNNDNNETTCEGGVILCIYLGEQQA